MKNKPYLTVNVAMSADGKIATSGREEIKISGEKDFCRVHELRDDVDAIIVGINTVLADDPKLTVKEKYVEHPSRPLRVVLDSRGEIPEDASIFDDDNYLIATTIDTGKKNHVRCGSGGRVDTSQLMDMLYEKGVRSVLVEGGGEVIGSFFSEKLVDRFYVFVGSIVIGGRDAPTPVDGIGANSEEDIIKLKLTLKEPMDDGILLGYDVIYDD